MSRFFIFPLLFGLAACSQFQTGRSYLSEMEYDDSPYYRPAVDFPVLAGDTGSMGRRLEDYEPATPLSKDAAYARKRESSLEGELLRLESVQSEEELDFYQSQKKYFSTTSEKIYFLKLPSHERDEYLGSRGFAKMTDREEDSASRQPASYFGVRTATLGLGMNKDEVVESLGRPYKVEIAGNPSFENERWVYKMNGATKYIYFESGTVQGWE
jgi:hypothetical protein